MNEIAQVEVFNWEVDYCGVFLKEEFVLIESFNVNYQELRQLGYLKSLLQTRYRFFIESHPVEFLKKLKQRNVWNLCLEMLFFKQGNFRWLNCQEEEISGLNLRIKERIKVCG